LLPRLSPLILSIMIISYGARNFFSFREGFEVSFEFPAKCPESIKKGRKLANVMCVKGANASGKTNVLKALTFIQQFTVHSWNSEEGQQILIMPFFDSTDSSELYVELLSGEQTYRYELECTPLKVISEKLYRIKEREVLLFDREEDSLSSRINEFAELDVIKLKPNASLISTAHQYDLDCISQIYNLFQASLYNIFFTGREQGYAFDLTKQSQLYKEAPHIATRASEFIAQIDPSIVGFQIQEYMLPEGKKTYFPSFEHRLSETETRILPYNLQSNGIKTLYHELSHYIFALDSASVLILDEFDTHLHPDILPLLIDLFENPETNPNNAQFIFTAHNSEVLKSMSKYETILVNKEMSESYAYRVDELPDHAVRVDRSLRRYYESGKLGGRPVIQDAQA